MTELVLIKYGGNAMRSDELKRQIVAQITELRAQGLRVVVVHGGGPFIGEMLTMAGIESEFVAGHRRTTPDALRYVEMALKGRVNGELVRLFNSGGQRAVGLSGKDGRMVTAVRRVHSESVDGATREHDLGQVGDVDTVDTTLLSLLLARDYLPVVTCIAADAAGEDYNINADMFAGHLAGALGADRYLVLTDVDGVLTDINDPTSLISDMSLAELQDMMGTVIVGGMIPKLESCRVALENGAAEARIVNGMKPAQLRAAASGEACGTRIVS
ncbi:MAG: acetylglutamate kinase [Bacteroidota bacterium]|nr:acetylglutamate kinase [Bacteroidota bacterium]